MLLVRKLFNWVLIAACLGSNLARAAVSDADCIMDWAESLLPAVLSPAKQPTQSIDIYSYRAYPASGVYLGVGGAQVVAVGGLVGNQLKTLGTVADFLPLARAASCGTPTPVPTPICPQLVVPAYFYASNKAWADLAKVTQPTVIIANVSNGAGKVVDTQFVAVINAARTAGHRVKGYVYTQYGGRSATQVLADMDAWSRLYGVNDYFIDEASALAKDLPYYRNLLQTALATITTRRFMLNPGAPPDRSYFDLVAGVEIVVYETVWSTYTTNPAFALPTWLDAVASQTWIMALNASAAEMQAAAALARQRGFAGFFATDVSFVARLPTYWAQETGWAGCR